MSGGYYPKKRGRRRKYKPLKPWETIHKALARILDDITYHSVDKAYAKMVYYGNKDMLKAECIRIMNAIERLEKEQEDAETRR